MSFVGITLMWNGWKLWATALGVFALLQCVYYGVVHPELRGTRRGMLAIEDEDGDYWLFIALISLAILAVIIITALLFLALLRLK